MKYLELTIGAMLVYNFVLSRFLGICPFLGVSKRLGTAMGMSGAVIAVMTIASFLTATVKNYLLYFEFANGNIVSLAFLETMVFILVIAALVQLLEIMLQKTSPVLYGALGIYLPLITTNCAVLGVATLSAKLNYTILESTVFGFFSGLGFALALLLFASLREKLEIAAVPKLLQGTAIALITAGILAMAFIGFSGFC